MLFMPGYSIQSKLLLWRKNGGFRIGNIDCAARISPVLQFILDDQEAAELRMYVFPVSHAHGKSISGCQQDGTRIADIRFGNFICAA